MQKFFILLACAVIVWPLSACGKSQAELQAQIDAYDARTKAFEEQGTVVSQTTGTVSSKQSLAEAEAEVRKKCLAERTDKSQCENIKAIYNNDGTISVRHEVNYAK